MQDLVLLPFSQRLGAARHYVCQPARCAPPFRRSLPLILPGVSAPTLGHLGQLGQGALINSGSLRYGFVSRTSRRKLHLMANAPQRHAFAATESFHVLLNNIQSPYNFKSATGAEFERYRR